MATSGCEDRLLRPIFMSTLTSVFGMLPLVLFPGEGSELYRGLGSVVVGGLATSALLTLLTVPPLLGIVLRGVPSIADETPPLSIDGERPAPHPAE